MKRRPVESCSTDGGQILRDLVKFLVCREEAQRLACRLTIAPYVVDFEGDCAFELPVDKTATVLITPLDANGNPARIQSGSAVWTSSDEMVAKVAPTQSNELEAVIAMVGPPGAVTIRLDCDARLGPRVETITFIAEVTGVTGQAVSGTVEFSQPK